MNNAHVKNFFPAWLDGKLSADREKKLERHLESCKECRDYYQKMSDVLKSPQVSRLKTLEPDPYLPTRVKALAEQVKNKKQITFDPQWLRVALYSLLIAFALSLGGFMGYHIFQPQPDENDLRITQAYYQAFASGSVVDRFENYLQQQQEDAQ